MPAGSTKIPILLISLSLARLPLSSTFSVIHTFCLPTIIHNLIENYTCPIWIHIFYLHKVHFYINYKLTFYFMFKNTEEAVFYRSQPSFHKGDRFF